MIKKLLLTFAFGLPFATLAQVTFTNSNSHLANSNVTSGCAIGISDMNNDGLDDIVRLDDARNLQIEYQNASGNFTLLNYGSIPGSGSEWGMAIADVDKNGYNDIFVGGAYNGLKLLTANSTGTNYAVTVFTETASYNDDNSIFLQNANFVDIDNNGSIDIFGCSDESVSSAYNNDGNGVMTLDNAGLINAVSTVASDNSGNYGSIWMDYDNDGDQDLYISKCRLGVGNSNDGRRINLLYKNNGNGTFTEVGVAAGLVPYAQSWAAAFDDIDNDGDLDCVVVNHDITSKIYENNGDGTFTDITASSGIASELDDLGDGGIEVMMADFDNDTYIDLFITSRNSSHKHLLFKNNGNKTFSVMPNNPLNAGTKSIQSAAVGDLNNDGFMDIMAGFATGYNNYSSTPDILFLNNGNTNNWSEITLIGGPSNRNGIGARIEIYGDWGKQIREVRSGESYGTMNSLTKHFGLGTAEAITKIVVRWPSGTVDQFLSPTINERLTLNEGATLGINPSEDSVFKVYPNPVKNSLTIEGLQNVNTTFYEVYNITGKVIVSRTSLSNTTNQIDMSTLKSGVYFLNLFSDNQRYVHKIIKD